MTFDLDICLLISLDPNYVNFEGKLQSSRS